MRIGYAASPQADAAAAVAGARAAEEAGFHELWLPEDYCERGAFAVAGAVATATESITIGIGVVNPWTRHPVLTAMEAAAVDELSDGRLVLGLGASNERWMSQWLGIPFSAPVSRTRDAMGIIRDLLAGKHVSRAFGENAVDTALSFVPTRADVPIYLGAKGKRALAVAGAHADGALLSVLSAPAYITWAREQLQAPGKPVCVYVVFACSDDAQEVRARVRRTVGKYLGIHGDQDITRVAGLDPELGREFRARLLRGQEATSLVTDQILDTFAIAGDTDQCLDGLARFRAAGADTLVLVGDAEATAAETVAAARVARSAGLVDP